MKVKQHKRAPNGYRIEQWTDGFYHVYRDGFCIDEVLSKQHAIRLAWEDKIKQTSPLPDQEKE